MKFGSWTYDGFRLDLVPEGTDGQCAGDIKKFIRHGEWELTSMPCVRQEVVYECCLEPYPDITYTLDLRRRHMFYFVNMIAPCFLISGLLVCLFVVVVILFVFFLHFCFRVINLDSIVPRHLRLDYVYITVKVSRFVTERLSTGFRFGVYTQNMNLV